MPKIQRNRAIGVIIGGMKQKDVASSLEKPLRTVQRWWSRYNGGLTLQHVPPPWAASKISRETKIVIAKSLAKIQQSTGKLAKRITQKGHDVSKSTVHRYLRKSVGATAFKRPKILKN